MMRSLFYVGFLAAALVVSTSLIERPAGAPPINLEAPATAREPVASKLQLVQAPAKKHARGRKNPSPEVLARRHAWAKAKHDHRMAMLPKATPPAFNTIDLGWVPPIRDQGQCGSCWDFSGTGVASAAFIKKGWGKNDGTFHFSEQFSLDCWQNGGCNGDDNIDVLTQAKDKGLAVDDGSVVDGAKVSGYGSYQASGGRCNLPAGAVLYPLKDWGYCTPNQQQGVAAVQDIKNALVAYGPIGVGIDAGVLGDGTGIISGTGHSIDHDVIIVGWDDSKGQGGCWLMRNSWGTSWGNAGYCWIQYGSGDIGTEACWALAPDSPNPPPVPPGPTPPVPPVPPGPGPVPSGVTLTLYQDQVASILGQSGAVQITKDTKVSDLIQYITDAMKREGKGFTPKAPCCLTPAPTLAPDPIPSALYDRLNRIEMHQRDTNTTLTALTKNLDITAGAVLELQKQLLKK